MSILFDNDAVFLRLNNKGGLHLATRNISV